MIYPIILSVMLAALVIAPAPPPAPIPHPRIYSPKAKEQIHQTMAKPKTEVVTGPIMTAISAPGKVITIAADFPSLRVTNDFFTNGVVKKNGYTNRFDDIRLFFDVTLSVSNPVFWTRTFLPYSDAGGTGAIPVTNTTGKFFYRAGYQFTKPPTNAYHNP